MRFNKRIIGASTAMMLLFSQVALAGTHTVANEYEFKKAISSDGLAYDGNIFLNLGSGFAIDYSRANSLVDQAIKESGDLANLINGYSTSFSISGQNVTAAKIYLKYIETAEQKTYVDNFIKNNIANIIASAKTDVDKVLLINEWIRNNVAYDHTYTKYSSYNALVDKSTVCNGYSMLFNRMAQAAGLESKVIVGKGKGENHAWNAVKLNGYWYFIDPTWNDSQPANAYFLLSLQDIAKDHVAESVIPQPVAQKSYYVDLADKITQTKSLTAFETFSKMYGDFGFSTDVLYNAALRSLKEGKSQRVVYRADRFGTDLSSVMSALSSAYTITGSKYYYGGELSYGGSIYKVYDLLVSGTLKQGQTVPPYKNLGLISDTIQTPNPTASIKFTQSFLAISPYDSVDLFKYMQYQGVQAYNIRFTNVSGNSVQVAANGAVKVVSAGETTIKAWDSLNPTTNAQIVIAVKDAFGKITPVAESLNLDIKKSHSLTELFRIDGISLDKINFTVSDTTVAKIDGNYITPLKEGSIIVTATDKLFPTNKASIIAKFINAQPAYVKFKTNYVNIEKGKTTDLFGYIEYGNIDKSDIAFKISDASVATVNGSYLTGLKAGTAALTAYSKANQTITSEVKVVVAEPVQQIYIKKISDPVIKGIGTSFNALQFVSYTGTTVSNIGYKLMTTNGVLQNIGSGYFKSLKAGRDIVRVYAISNPNVYVDLNVEVINTAIVSPVRKLTLKTSTVETYTGKITDLSQYVSVTGMSMSEVGYKPATTNGTIKFTGSSTIQAVKPGEDYILVYDLKI